MTMPYRPSTLLCGAILLSSSLACGEEGSDEASSSETTGDSGEVESTSDEGGDGDGAESSGGDGDEDTGSTGDGDGDAQGNGCGLPEWNTWTPTNGESMARIVGVDGEGVLIDMCDLTNAPTLIDMSYPGCPPCESLSKYLSLDGAVPDDPFTANWAQWANNINGKLEAGELNFITLVTDLTAFEQPGPAAAWHEAYPHDHIHDLELHASTGVSYDHLATITTGFPSFWYVGADLKVISAPIIGASSPEEAYEGLILANEG